MNPHAAAEVVVEDASKQLADTAAATSYEDLPPSVVTAAKWAILDTIGVCLAATATSPEYLDPVRGLLHESAAPGNVPAPTLGLRVSPFDAMLWLGALAHTLDFDDVAGYSHPSAPAVTAALPIAHMRGYVDGRRFITAVALGQDMVIRLAQALRRPVTEYGWLPSMPGIPGAAITTAKLLDLDAAQTRSALGLALHQTSGTMQSLARPGSAYRAVREGFNSRAGALSALLAGHGMPGDSESLEGQFGYFPQFFRSDYDAEFLRGSELLGPLISFKLWPCAGHPQLFLTALASLLDGDQLRPEAVKAIRITGCSDVLPHQCEPLEARAAPSHSIDAKVSIPFLIGKLMVRRTLTIEDFSAEGLNDEAARAIGRRVEWQLDPTFKRGANGYGLGVVEVEHNDGSRVRGEAEYPLGHPNNPPTWDQIVEKFHACMAAAAIDMSAVADEVAGQVENLEAVDDVGGLLELVFEGSQR